jgi:hypothetical protein
LAACPKLCTGCASFEKWQISKLSGILTGSAGDINNARHW